MSRGGEYRSGRPEEMGGAANEKQERAKQIETLQRRVDTLLKKGELDELRQNREIAENTMAMVRMANAQRSSKGGLGVNVGPTTQEQRKNFDSWSKSASMTDIIDESLRNNKRAEDRLAELAGELKDDAYYKALVVSEKELWGLREQETKAMVSDAEPTQPIAPPESKSAKPKRFGRINEPSPFASSELPSGVLSKEIKAAMDEAAARESKIEEAKKKRGKASGSK